MLAACHRWFDSLTKDCPSRAQYAVLTKKLGIQKVFLVIGFSMGGQQVDFPRLAGPIKLLI
jgi:homoserine acetyltransferase